MSSSATFRRISRAAAAVLALCAARTPADPLNPLNFPSLGSVTLPAGTYTLDTGATAADTPTLSVGLVSYLGSVATQPATFNPQIAVFDFDQLTLGPGATIRVTGNRPLALLSRSDILVQQGAGVVIAPGSGGGGYGSGREYTGNGPGTGGSSVFAPPGAGGGGFGGRGGSGNGAFTPNGGPTYGDLIVALQGGSGGGNPDTHGFNNPGGDGGGAVEFGALTQINFTAGSIVDARGGMGPILNVPGAGGGSGGGILLHAPNLSLTSTQLIARGGDGRTNPIAYVNGGGGGGGRIVLAPDTYTVGDNPNPSNAVLDVAGGAGISGQASSEPGSPGSVRLQPLTTIVPNGRTLNFNDLQLPSGPELALRNLLVQTGGAAVGTGPYTANGSISVQGGGLLAVTGALTSAGRVTLGQNAALTAGGRITATGAWLLQGAPVSAPGGLTIDGAGTLTGNGSVAGRVISPTSTDPAAIAVNAVDGTLTLGDANASGGVDVDRLILIGGSTAPGRLLLLSQDQAKIGNTVLAAATSLQAPNGTALRGKRQLTAAADTTVSGNFTNFGTVAGPAAAGQFLTFTDDVDGPGVFQGNIRHKGVFSPAATTGASVSAGADLEFAPSGGLRVEIRTDGTLPRLKVGGHAILAGTLHILTAEGFVADPLTAYPLIAASSRTGVFTAYTGTDAGNGRVYAPIYSDTGLALIPTLAGDANVDGRVNFDDLVALAQRYNTPAGNLWTGGDFTGDGAVDFDDLVFLAQHYNTSVTSPAPGPAAASDFARDWSLAHAPEPAALPLLILAPVLLARRRRRREPRPQSGLRPPHPLVDAIFTPKTGAAPRATAIPRCPPVILRIRPRAHVCARSSRPAHRVPRHPQQLLYPLSRGVRRRRAVSHFPAPAGAHVSTNRPL